MKANKEEFSIKDLFLIFVPKIWLIVIVALVFALGLGCYSAFIKADTYTSSATMMISKASTTINSNDRDLASKMVDTYKVVIYSDEFLREVCNDIRNKEEYQNKGWNLSPASLSSMISISQYGDTEAFEVSVTSRDTDLSYAVATSLSIAIRDNLPNKLPYEKGSIYTTIINTAVRSTTANSKNVVRNAIIGLFVGAILSMVAIFIYNMFDVTIRDRKKLEDNFDIPVLGVIPRFITDEEGKK